jgi:hypothetical protein
VIADDHGVDRAIICCSGSHITVLMEPFYKKRMRIVLMSSSVSVVFVVNVSVGSG